MGEKEKMIEKREVHNSHVIDVDNAWLNCMKERFLHGNSSYGDAGIIYRVPETIRKGNKAAYDPKILSIGPYHHGKKNLQAMEAHKWRYLHDLFSRNPKSKFENCLKEIKELEVVARSCYSEEIGLGSNEFVEIMVLDGCFILEYFLKRLQVVKKDPIFTMIWMSPIIYYDIFLVENQLPFFILRRLFDLVIRDVMSITSPSSVEELVMFFLEWNGKIPPIEPVHHLLHLLHMGLSPTIEFENSKTHPQNSLVDFTFKKLKNLFPSFFESSSENQTPRTIPSATELQEAGLKFKKIDSGSFLDIKFSHGVMEIPSFYIHDGSNSRFRNLITLEQCISNSETYLTSYASFMNCLINTSKDVAILDRNGIIKNALGSNKEVAVLFNQLCKDIFIDVENNYLSEVFKEVNRYHHTRWHKWRASLKRDYFSNPWAILSFLAAIVLLGLTVAQTFFSAYSYFRPPS